MAFLNEQLFETPVWMLDHNILERIEYSGFLEQMRSMQVRTLNNVLSLGKMARLIEFETSNSKEAYSLIQMMSELRKSIWSELKNGGAIDTYRRNLQKAYVDRLEYLLTVDNQSKSSDFGGYRKSTVVNTSQSDIRTIARAELNILNRDIKNVRNRTSDLMTKYHLNDVSERINLILDPK